MKVNSVPLFRPLRKRSICAGLSPGQKTCQGQTLRDRQAGQSQGHATIREWIGQIIMLIRENIKIYMYMYKDYLYA